MSLIVGMKYLLTAALPYENRSLIIKITENGGNRKRNWTLIERNLDEDLFYENYEKIETNQLQINAASGAYYWCSRANIWNEKDEFEIIRKLSSEI